jgi:hypothetical protein
MLILNTFQSPDTRKQIHSQDKFEKHDFGLLQISPPASGLLKKKYGVKLIFLSFSRPVLLSKTILKMHGYLTQG